MAERDRRASERVHKGIDLIDLRFDGRDGLTSEATTALRWPIEQVALLSIGTTHQPFDVSQRRREGGLLKWNRAVVDLLSIAQVKGMLGLASAMTAQRMVRIDTIARCGHFALDNSKEVLDLRGLGENAARMHMEQVSQQFLSSPAAPVQPSPSVVSYARATFLI